MDFHKLIARYQQFGGFRLIWEYAKIGALLPAINAGVRCGVKQQSFKQIYPKVLKKVEPFLIQKYGTQIPQIAQKVNANMNLPNKANNGLSRIREFENRPIWFCWLQGLEQAPEIVHACYNSIKRNIPDREIKIIANENWKEYVELPDYIVKKWKKGRIPAALFSDLLRLELLIKYGGTWIDSTVLCTGLNENHNVNDNFLDADLFLFQYTKQGSIPASISNWFISACANNEVLIVLRERLYTYWKDYNCTLDYYIFHLFFSMISKKYPHMIASMPYGNSMDCIVLLQHWGEKFNQKKFDRLTSHVCFHKLAFRVHESIKNDKDNYYNHILNIERN